MLVKGKRRQGEALTTSGGEEDVRISTPQMGATDRGAEKLNKVNTRGGGFIAKGNYSLWGGRKKEGNAWS